MATQTELPFTAHARRTDPQESKDAAKAASKAKPRHSMVLDAIEILGPRACDENIIEWISQLVKCKPSSVRRWRLDLVRMGKVVKVGTVPTETSVSAVWGMCGVSNG